MQGAIRNIESLQSWFEAVGAPFFTLFYTGNTSQVIIRNTTEADMEKAWEILKNQVLHQAEYGRATLHVLTYKKTGSANNPDGRTNIDIAPMQSQQGAQMAGIGALPAGYVSQDEFSKRLKDERQRWELERKLEDLEAKIDNPDGWAEKLMAGIERIGGTDLGKAMIARFMGVPFSAMAPGAPINGTPAATNPAEDTFEEDLDIICQILNTDDVTLARKLRQLVEQNPEMAKNLVL